MGRAEAVTMDTIMEGMGVTLGNIEALEHRGSTIDCHDLFRTLRRNHPRNILRGCFDF
jgi:hypothetical protein